jgi:O-antigen biosynthesis protein
MKKIKVFLCWTLNSGTSFYRFFNPMKYMRKEISHAFSKWRPDFQEVADWEYKINSKTDPQVAKDLDFLTAECDMTIAQKFHSHGGLALMDYYRNKYPKKKWYTEIDDHVFAINPSSPAYESYHPGSEGCQIFKEQLQMSNGLIVSTENLRQVYEKINPNVWVVPNGIDFALWDNIRRPMKRNKKIRIGWAGGGSHVDDLEFIEPAVTKIAKKFANVEFVFLGGVPACYKDRTKIKAITKWYPINEYPQAVADLNLDIALAPLLDNEFNRAKSNLRWLEYSALRVPTIASDVEPFRCIDNGKDGFLVTEVDEWEGAMEAMITHEAERRAMGVKAYERVKKDYNVEKIAAQYVDYIKAMHAGKTNISAHAIAEAMAGQ